MKMMKKMFALMAAAVMMLVMGSLVSAAGTGKITITPPVGTPADATNTYKVYRVFDADGAGAGGGISYKLKSNHSLAPNGFTVDGAGNVTYTGSGVGGLTPEDIAEIADYVTEDDLVDTVHATGPDPVTTIDLPNGYYYITTTTGTVVTIDSTNPSASVNDKNTVPTVDKQITGVGSGSFDDDGKKALAQVGTDVSYSSTITVGKGAKNYVFHDKMGTGLAYKNDVKVQVGGVDVPSTGYINAPVGSDTITITFKDEYIKTLTEGTDIVISYSATITSDALTVDPAKNTAYVSYGDENSSNKTPDSETKVYNAQLTVNKKDGEGEALPGAGFVIMNSAGKYYKIQNKVVSWETSINDATEHFSDPQGLVPAFTGLANGTYTLVENTVPSGYNKAEDVTFTVVEDNFTIGNLQQTTNVVNKAGSELPSTGGVGTTIFYVLGVILVLGAGVFSIARRRNNQ